MEQDAIGAARRGPRMSIRRLLGLHEHVFGAWGACWAAPHGQDRMLLLQTRSCAHCRRVEFKRELTDVPATGFPYALHMDAAVRRPD